MQYLLLIYDKESDWGTLSEAQQSAMMKEYQDFTKSINESGHWRASSQLHPVSKATTVRIRDGKKMVTDGPFAETKEQLGGFYLVEAKDLDEAVALAARVPSARFGSIEVRPLVGRNRLKASRQSLVVSLSRSRQSSADPSDSESRWQL
jgi:hypothetical protein